MSPAAKPVRAGVVGFGFMGQTHVRAYQSAADDGLPVTLAAVADLSGALATGRAATQGNINTGAPQQVFDPARVRTFSTAHDLFASGLCDLVSICTPTDTHVDLASAALRAGLHVLLEKPVTVEAAHARALLRIEQASGRRLMPAMCMRFWPGWPFLREALASGTYGPLRSLKFARLGSRPDWSSFYADNRRCGDAITDLHLHDVDFLTHLLGFPDRLFSIGSTSHLTTVYLYDQGPFRHTQVTAEGGWLDSQGRGFRMRYVAEFETATAEFDLAADQPLRITSNGATTGIQIPTGTGYDHEVRAMIRWVADGSTPPVTLQQAACVLDVIETERRSLASGRIEPVSLG